MSAAPSACTRRVGATARSAARSHSRRCRRPERRRSESPLGRAVASGSSLMLARIGDLLQPGIDRQRCHAVARSRGDARRGRRAPATRKARRGCCRGASCPAGPARGECRRDTLRGCARSPGPRPPRRPRCGWVVTSRTSASAMRRSSDGFSLATTWNRYVPAAAGKRVPSKFFSRHRSRRCPVSGCMSRIIRSSARPPPSCAGRNVT